MSATLHDEPRGRRGGWLLVGATIVAWSFLLYGYNDSYPALALVEVIAGLFGIAVVVTALWHRGDDLPVGFGPAAFIATASCFFIWCWIQVRVAPSYGTDEAAFDQYAAMLVQHGLNPYTHSMAPAFPLFHVSPDGYTFTIAGRPVTSLSYPALSFLLYLPMLWFGIVNQAAIVLNVVAWALAVAVAYRLLPRDLRPLSLVLGSFAVYTGFAVGGVTDVLYLPFLLLAIYRWDRWPTLSGWRSWLSPVMLGLALSVKQTPWFIAPFLLLGLFLEAHTERGLRASLRVTGDYLLRVTVTFVAVNSYFIALNPAAWLHGIMTPFLDRLVPAGEGWVALSDFLGRGGGNLHLYSLLLLSIGLVCAAYFAGTYPRSKSLLVFVPSIILFFAERSYANYLVMLLLPALVGFATVSPVENDTPRLHHLLWGGRRRWALAAATATLPASLALVAFTGAPLSLRVVSVETTGQLATVIDTTVVVTNHTGRRERPVFTSEDGGSLTAPWNVLKGPGSLAPHGIATYRLQAPNFFAQPSLTSGFQMAALTSTPEAMSVSRPFTPTYWHVNLNPEAVNRPVGVNVPVTLSAELLSPTDGPVDDSGIPVYLGQVSYTQQGLVFTQAVINGSAEGATPVEALTNSHGVAKFVVTSPVGSVNPVYFEANLVNGSQEYPYGYSNIVPIRFAQ